MIPPGGFSAPPHIGKHKRVFFLWLAILCVCFVVCVLCVFVRGCFCVCVLCVFASRSELRSPLHPWHCMHRDGSTWASDELEDVLRATESVDGDDDDLEATPWASGSEFPPRPLYPCLEAKGNSLSTLHHGKHTNLVAVN